MRTRQSIQLVAVLLTVSTLAACGGRYVRDDDGYRSPRVVVWDSRPIDENYRRQREAMEYRHRYEALHRAEEAADRREARQQAERRELEDRYRYGKEKHMKQLPPGRREDGRHDNGKHKGDKHEDHDKQ